MAAFRYDLYNIFEFSFEFSALRCSTFLIYFSCFCPSNITKHVIVFSPCNCSTNFSIATFLTKKIVTHYYKRMDLARDYLGLKCWTSRLHVPARAPRASHALEMRSVSLWGAAVPAAARSAHWRSRHSTRAAAGHDALPRAVAQQTVPLNGSH